jgi:16S rRNA (guanine527-N7)-methyltransferase
MTLAAQLEQGLLVLGIDLPNLARNQLLAYAALLDKWNKTYRLTGQKDPSLTVSHHLLDSLAILPHVGPGPLLDVGSGGGLPGLPLAIARRDLAVAMVDTVQKKASFLQQAAIELGLENVTVHHARVEEMQGQYAQISSRAFAELGIFVSLTRHLLAPGGRWLAMKGLRPGAELQALPADITVDAVIPLAVPGLDAERHLIILKAGS